MYAQCVHLIEIIYAKYAQGEQDMYQSILSTAIASSSEMKQWTTINGP